MHKSQVKCATMLRSLMKIPPRLDEICSYKPMGLSVYSFFTGWRFFSNTYKHAGPWPDSVVTLRVGVLLKHRVPWSDISASLIIGLRINIERISMPDEGK